MRAATFRLVLSATVAAAPALAAEPQLFPGYLAFEGRALAVLSDADMVASAYMDGDLGPTSEALADTLTVFPLENGRPGAPITVPVSNAVTAWPSLLVLSEDGRFAYVAETDGPRGEAAALSELAFSPVVRVVEIGEGGGRVVQEVETAGRAQGLSLRPQGDVLAVNIVETGRPQIGLLDVGADGRLADFRAVDLPEGMTFPRDVAWSPDGTILAATFPAEHGARFFRWDDGTLTPLGDLMVTGKLAGVGQWSADGGHFFVTNLYWLGGAADLYVGANLSSLSAIRVDPAGDHVVVSAAATGASAENFAISPDGRHIVTLNMENSFLPPGDPRLTWHSSLTLIEWDAEAERLTALGTTPFEGILPEGITFDASGNFLAVANFAHANPERPIEETTVDLWRLVDGPVPFLLQMDAKLPVMRGAHVVKLVR